MEGNESALTTPLEPLNIVSGEEENDFEQPEDKDSGVAELQAMILNMKDDLKRAVEALGHVQYGDRILQEKMDNNRVQQEQHLSDVVSMVLDLKNEFGMIVGQLQTTLESQKLMSRQIEALQYERDILLEELQRNGAIDESLRNEYHSGKTRPVDLNRFSETPLSVLLDRARQAFRGSLNCSDHDSGVAAGGMTPPTVSPIEQRFVSSFRSPSHLIDKMCLEDPEDADSSIAATANRSLDLSRSLGDKFSELTYPYSSQEEDELDEDIEGHIPQINSEITAENVTPSFTLPQPSGSKTPFSRPSTVKKVAPHERSAKDFLRIRILRELLDTERKYCNSLWIVLDHFSWPVWENNLLPKKDFLIAFPPCLRKMYEYHCNFLRILDERFASWDWQGSCGDLLQKMFDSQQSNLLDLYQQFISEFPSALQHVKKFMKTSVRFKRFIRKRQMDDCCGGLDLGAHLLTPVQRVPRYVLLLQELQKNTEPDHVDFNSVQVVLEQMAEFLTQLNNSISYSLEVMAADNTSKQKKGFNLGREKRRHTTIVYHSQSTPIIENAALLHGEYMQSPDLKQAELRRHRTRDRTFAGSDNSSVKKHCDAMPLSKYSQINANPDIDLQNHVQVASESMNRDVGDGQEYNSKNSLLYNTTVHNVTECVQPINQSVYHDHSYLVSTDEMLGINASIKSLPNRCGSSMSKNDAFSSMPSTLNSSSYGIYGDEEASQEDISFQPFNRVESYLQKSCIETYDMKSRSHDGILNVGPPSPTQRQIAASLAKSLGDNTTITRGMQTESSSKVHVQGSEKKDPPKVSSTQKTKSNYFSQPDISKIIRSSFRSKKRICPQAPEEKHKTLPSKVNDSLNASVIDHSNTLSPGLNITLGGEYQAKYKEIKKRRKEKPMKLMDSLNLTACESQKKGFKESLKNLFKRRYHSARNDGKMMAHAMDISRNQQESSASSKEAFNSSDLNRKENIHEHAWQDQQSSPLDTVHSSNTHRNSVVLSTHEGTRESTVEI